MGPKDAIKMAKDADAKFVDYKFIDLPGMWQHKSCPISEFDEEVFVKGTGFDGSSIRGWKAINSSDMLLVPDPATAKIDPFMKDTTLSLICNVRDPLSGEAYDRDPRTIGARAVEYMKSTKIADTANMGPEPEFFILNHVQYGESKNEAYFQIDSPTAHWNTGAHENGANLGYKQRPKEGYFPVSPTDRMQDLRSEMVLEMEKMGIVVECHHSEVASGGQAEIDMRFAPMEKMADQLMWYKYICKNVAFRNGYTVTFMPKPIFGDNGSGMHTHQSLWKDGKPLFAGKEYAGLSKMALSYIAGIVKHAPAIMAFTNPGTNSYKRLVPGYEAPIYIAYSARNRSAAIRIPMYESSPKATRIEVRFPDPSCNPYLAFTAMLMAGLDGVKKGMEPPAPMDGNLYELTARERRKLVQASHSLEQSLMALEKDHDFLTEGGVMSEDFIGNWIDYKLNNEARVVDARPHPKEFDLYFDI